MTPQTDTDDGPDESDLKHAAELVAAANDETAAAVTQAVGLVDARHPEMTLSSTQEKLREAYSYLRQALDHVEHTRDRLDEDYGTPTPRQIKSEHADRLREQYDGPVLYLALELLESNRREWLHARPDTNGAEAVERHGLTASQREWLNQLREAWRTHDGGEDDE